MIATRCLFKYLCSNFMDSPYPCDVDMPRLIKLISNCWLEAELRLRLHLVQHPDKGEVFITDRFQDELKDAFSEASLNHKFENALRDDLRESLSLSAYDLVSETVSKGLIADVTFHDPQRERKTGGDLGLAVVRPRIRANTSELEIQFDQRQGILCQAKLRRRSSRGPEKWGLLTKTQRNILPGRTSYLALLLYQYADTARRELHPFSWQLCSGMQVEDIEECLKTDNFPNPKFSDTVIKSLSAGEVGTNNEREISEWICPASRPSLVIRIGWKPGGQPDAIHQLSRTRQRQQIQIRLLEQ